MILRYDSATPGSHRRVMDMTNIWHGGSAFLVGGGPSLRELVANGCVKNLQSPGIVTMAMNNSVTVFRKPSMWCGCDHPACYSPELLQDGSIMKFAPLSYSEAVINSEPYRYSPNTMFFLLDDKIPWSSAFEVNRGLPWFGNTMFVAIVLLYMLGFRRIFLVGCDLGFTDKVYGYPTDLSEAEKEWNRALYKYQREELAALRPVFEANGLTITPCTTFRHSGHVLYKAYDTMSVDDAIEKARQPLSLSIDKCTHSSQLINKTKPLQAQEAL